MRPIHMIVVHCSDSPAALDIGAEEIDRWHKQRGWQGIGYHFVIRRSGAVETGRPLETPGAHVVGHNKHSIGVCLVGGHRGEADFTFAQWAALRELLDDLVSKFPGAAVLGHRDLDEGKKCPGFDVKYL